MQNAPPLLLDVFHTFDPGGAQTRFVSLANHFGRALRHIVVAMDGRNGMAAELKPDLDIVFRNVAVLKGQTLANSKAFRSLLRELRPDILVTHNWGTIEWAMANWPRLVRHIHFEDGFGPDETDRQFPRRVWARRLLLRRSTVIVPSRNLQRIAREIWRLPESAVRYIPNGIDCARFAAAPDPALMRKWSGDGPIIGTVAALRGEKNTERLIRAFGMAARDTPCRLVIVGDGAERPRLEKLMAELGLSARVTFTGTIAGTERVYGGFDIFALTSDTEQMPYTVLEAMAASRPVVATDVGDIRHMVAPENLPYLVARDDAAVAEALRLMVADGNLRSAVGQANRDKVVADYDQSRMFAAFAQAFGIECMRAK